MAASDVASLERTGKGGWFAVWRLVITHPWYRAELKVAAWDAVHRAGRSLGSRGLEEDVRHDATLLLARSLRRDPTLGFNRGRLDDFASWLGRIARNDCRSAVRRLRRLARDRVAGEARYPLRAPDGELLERPSALAQEVEAREAAAELYLAISRLADPGRSVLALVASGLPLSEVGDRLGLSYSRVWHIYRDACGRIRKAIQGEWVPLLLDEEWTS